MNGKAWARDMALYNTWQNEALYGHCAALTEPQRREDRGMFFGNIHHTLDHILMVDERLFAMVTTGAMPAVPFEPRKLVRESFAALSADRARFDADLLAAIGGWDDDWLEEMIAFRGRQTPRRLFAMQLFNHATHHRSQVTSELHKLGIDYGNTDMPFNPRLPY